MDLTADNKICILVVEESPPLASKLKNLLEKHGHQVALAGNGYDAFSLINETGPDIIFVPESSQEVLNSP